MVNRKTMRFVYCMLGLIVAMSVAAGPVSDKDIASLEAESASAGKIKSSVETRLAYKSVIRQGKTLLEAHPDARNRYRVLGIVFQAQKRLFGLDGSDRNRTELFETSEQLARAPDEYAELRLEADLLLSERDLAGRDASVEERAEALKAIVDRYRDTPAEARSLIMAAMIAPKLGAEELEDEVIQALTERFADNPTVIEFIQKNLGVRRLDVLFAGTFARADGASLRFPSDRLGHLCIMVFWSKESKGFENYLAQVKAYQTLHPGTFDVFSFNLDELPDAGEATLRSLELDWTAMRLPGGRQSQTYRTYAQKDPIGIMVNAYGHAVLVPAVVREEEFKIDDARISYDRYLAQVQSLFIGDFLVTDSAAEFDPALPPEMKMVAFGPDVPARAEAKDAPGEVPADQLRAIQACFINVPFRYRLTPAAALANYTKAEQLSREAIQQHPDAQNLWVVRNRRIVSLLGMWNLTGEPTHLEQALEESRTLLASNPPAAAAVVARFCLAKQSLREDKDKPASVVSRLIDESGGDQAPASAFAAATILALEAHEKELHQQYRAKFMDAPFDANPALWSFVSFLRDRYHQYHLFKGNFIRSEDRGARSYVINHGAPPLTDRLPDIELKALDGKPLSLPKDTNGRLTLLVFVEPPEVIKPVELDAKGKPKKKTTDYLLGVALKLAEQPVNKDLRVVPAFLSDDMEKIRAVLKAEELQCDPVIVPGGLSNPMVRRLGILSADRANNVFLIRRDGTIAWQSSGLLFKSDFGGGGYAIYLGMRVHIQICEVETGYEALRQGDFNRAASVFSGPFPVGKDERFGWGGPRSHGRALANMGLKQWDSALADIDVAITAHNGGDANSAPCDILSDMRLIRAEILEQLGRKEEAEAERKLAAAPTTPHRPSPYSVFQEKLVKLRREQR